MLLHSKKIGALIRVFAKEAHMVPHAVHQTMELAEKMLSMDIDDQAVIKRIEILIPMDTSYEDYDCGDTAKQIRARIKTLPWANGKIFVSEVQHGDIFCGILNYGMAKLLRSGCDYGLIISKEAGQYSNIDVTKKMVKAAEDGARVVGVALHELTESILQGRIANTFAMWHILSLLQVGGFDLRAAKQKKHAVIRHKIEAWDEKRSTPDWSYDLAGVEEIIPLIRLVRTFGPCIAPINPQGEDHQAYQIPDPTVDRLGYERHLNKMGTKRERQTYFANTENADLSFLEGGIIKEYRT